MVQQLIFTIDEINNSQEIYFFPNLEEILFCTNVDSKLLISITLPLDIENKRKKLLQINSQNKINRIKKLLEL
jgi:hypothetical protein